MMPATKCRDPAIAKGGMLSIATRVARNVVPHETHTATQAQYARRSCLGDVSDAGVNASEEAIAVMIQQAAQSQITRTPSPGRAVRDTMRL